MSRLLADGKPQPAWSDIIEVVRPRGSRSTFYEVTGVHAKHALIGDLLAQDTIDLMQIAMYYRRTAAVDQLIDEAKVWTYWAYRERLSMRYRIEPDLDERALLELFTATVGAWARRYPDLARALHHAPPICAVEDLLLLRPGQCSVVHALATLTQIMQKETDDSAFPAATPGLVR